MNNTIKITKISRTNHNPNNIQGECLLNGYKVDFSIQDVGCNHYKLNWVNFPTNLNWSKIIPTCTSDGGHEFYAGQEIIKEFKILKLCNTQSKI